MSEFIARIKAILDATEAEAKLKALQKNTETIKLKVELSGDGADIAKSISRQINSIADNAGKAGQNIGKQLEAGVDKEFKSVKLNGFYKDYFKQLEKDQKKAASLSSKYDVSDSTALKAINAKRSAISKENREYQKELQQRQKLEQSVDLRWQKNLFNQEQAQAKEREKELQQRQKTIQSISDSINTKDYDSQISTLNKRLSSYTNNSNQYKEVSTSLNELKNAYEELKIAKNSYDTEESDANYSGVIAAQEKYVSALKRISNELKILSNEQGDVLSPSTKASAIKSFVSYFNTNTKAAKEYKEEVALLQKELDEMVTISDKVKFDTHFKEFQTKAIKEGNTGKKWFDESKRAISQIAQFTGIYGVLQSVTQDLPRQMISAVKEVDAAQIELIKVSDAPTNQITAYWDEAAESAMKYGASISDVISSTADWSRLGYNLKDATVLSDATTLLQKVGDNMTQESSSQGLISTLRGFSMEVNEVQKIVDIANQVANTKPIDTAGIFEGLERSASSMSAANNTLEQTISLITAANSVVQDPDKIGTALKTISMRIRGADTELQDAGLDTEGMAESVAKLREEIIALSGVDIMSDADTFRSTYDILDELSSKWSELTDIQQASITELIAGKNQGNVVSAMMQNFSIARETLNTALNESEGSAIRELENYQKGIEYSLDRFYASFQNLSNTIIDSDFLKGLIDSGTVALGVLNALIDNFGTLNTLIGVAGGAFAAKTGLGKHFVVVYDALLYKVA